MACWSSGLLGAFLTKTYSVFNCVSFGTAGFGLKWSTCRFFPNVFNLVCWLLKRGPCCSHCNAGQVYYPLLARATSHLGEHSGPPLSLDGAQRPGPRANTRKWHTCCPEQTPPCSSCSAELSDPFVSQVPPQPTPPNKSWGGQIVKQGEVVANHYSETWCWQLSDLRGHAGGMWT